MAKSDKGKGVVKKFAPGKGGTTKAQCGCECNCANFPPDKTQANGHDAVTTHMSKVAF